MSQPIQAVLFDFDGTLYDQAKLRRRMAWELAKHYAARPAQWTEVWWLFQFRRIREALTAEKPDGILDKIQYERTAQRTGGSAVKLRRLAEYWLATAPLPHLMSCKYPLADRIFNDLRRQNIKIGVVSDYPAGEKMKAIGLTADVVIASTDPDVNRFKPHPRGYLLAAERLNAESGYCLVVGDRWDLDGEAAKRAEIKYCHGLKELERKLNDN